MNYEVNATFDGCSCGCTPYCEAMIISETREGLINGIAEFMSRYAVKTKNRFCKTRFSVGQTGPPSANILNEAEDKAETLLIGRQRIGKLSQQATRKFTPIYAAAQEGYELTAKQMEINEKKRETYLQQIASIEREIEILKRGLLPNDFKIEY